MDDNCLTDCSYSRRSVAGACAGACNASLPPVLPPLETPVVIEVGTAVGIIRVWFAIADVTLPCAVAAAGDDDIDGFGLRLHGIQPDHVHNSCCSDFWCVPGQHHHHIHRWRDQCCHAPSGSSDHKHRRRVFDQDVDGPVSPRAVDRHEQRRVHRSKLLAGSAVGVRKGTQYRQPTRYVSRAAGRGTSRGVGNETEIKALHATRARPPDNAQCTACWRGLRERVLGMVAHNGGLF